MHARARANVDVLFIHVCVCACLYVCACVCVCVLRVGGCKQHRQIWTTCCRTHFLPASCQSCERGKTSSTEHTKKSSYHSSAAVATPNKASERAREKHACALNPWLFRSPMVGIQANQPRPTEPNILRACNQHLATEK